MPIFEYRCGSCGNEFETLLRASSPEFGPKIEALVVYNSNPVAVAPE